MRAGRTRVGVLGLGVLAWLGGCSGASASAPGGGGEAPSVEVAREDRSTEDGLDWVSVTRSSRDPSEPLPLVVVVHGLGDRPENILRLFDDHPGDVRVVAPRAPTPYGRGGTWFSDRVRESDPAALAAEMRAVADRVVGWMDRVAEALPTEGEPVITGFSQGGMVSFAVALAHPEAVAGAVPLAGHVPEALWPASVSPALAATPIRALHGTADPVLPVGNVQAVTEHLQGLGADVQLHTYEGVEHRVRPPMRRRLHETVQGLQAGGSGGRAGDAEGD